MRAPRVLVTGASGFIGSGLVERLRAKGDAVHVLLRDGRKAAGFARMGCRVFRGDVTLAESLRPATAGCSTVIHCAVGGAELEQARAINVRGTLNVVEAAVAAGVRRVVYLSTVVAHGRRWPAILTEEAPLQFHGDHYAVSKAEAERAVVACSASIELTIVRPTIVYGPGSVRILADLDRVTYERIKLIRDGRGLLNLIYIDDLVEGIWLAATVPAAANEAFLMSAASPVSWREYVELIARMGGKPLPPSLPVWHARLEAVCSKWRFRFTRRPQRIEDGDLLLMNQHGTVSITKARRLLGFNPVIALREGMRRTETWMRQTGYLPQRSEARLAPTA